MKKTKAQETSARNAALKLAKICHITEAAEITFEFSSPDQINAYRIRVDRVCNCSPCVAERREELALKQDQSLINEVLAELNEEPE